jgi:hypothetical protein
VICKQYEEEKLIECQHCGWIGKESSLTAPWSGSEPCCPSCESTDFLDVQENEDDLS